MNPNVPTRSMSMDELRQQRDDVILKLIALREENESVAQMAFQVFYERYESYLLGLTRNVCSYFPKSSNELFEAVFQNTFMRVYLRAETFDSGKIKSTDLKTGIKAWLGRIADTEHKLLLRQLRKSPDIQLVEDIPITELDIEDIPAEESKEDPQSYQRQVLDQALATLSEMERYILVQSAAYEQEGKYLPSKFIDSTCKLWQITRVNFRKIKSTARQKVMAKLNQLLAIKST